MKFARASIIFVAVATRMALAQADSEPTTGREDAAPPVTIEEEYRAGEEQAAESGMAGFFQRSADNVTSQLMTGWRDVTGFIRSDPISDVGTAWREFNERQRYFTRLDMGMAYTVLYQTASDGPGPRTGSSGDFDFFGTWHLVGVEGLSAGRLGFSAEYRHNFGGPTPSELGRGIGSLLRTTNGFNDQGLTLRQLWWQQELADGKLFFRAGKITQSDFFSTNRFRSANFYFLNQAFSSSLAVPFPAAGLGAVGFAFPTDWLYVAAGFGEADPDDGETGFTDLFGEVDLFKAVELGFLTDLEGLGRGTYRFTFTHTDGSNDFNDPSGESVSMSIDQEMGPHFVPFMRYAYAKRDGLTQIRQILTLGVGVLDPFGSQGDIAGLGFAWAQPDNRMLDDEYVIEAFYRFQLTPTMQVTPDLQFIIDPTFNSEDDLITVLGIRFRIQY
ncbi:MAG: carbohydrate porin [Planctomycetota bacterium]